MKYPIYSQLGYRAFKHCAINFDKSYFNSFVFELQEIFIFTALNHQRFYINYVVLNKENRKLIVKCCNEVGYSRIKWPALLQYRRLTMVF